MQGASGRAGARLPLSSGFHPPHTILRSQQGPGGSQELARCLLIPSSLPNMLPWCLASPGATLDRTLCKHQQGLSLPPSHTEHCLSGAGACGAKESGQPQRRMMAGPSPMPMELWEACPGPSSHRGGCLPPSLGETGHSAGASQATQGPRPCQSPGSSSLSLSNLVQAPVREPQDAQRGEASVEAEGPGGSWPRCPPLLMRSLTQAQAPALSPRPAPRCLFAAVPPAAEAQLSPLHLLPGDCSRLLPGCGEHEGRVLEKAVQGLPLKLQWLHQEAGQACQCYQGRATALLLLGLQPQCKGNIVSCSVALHMLFPPPGMLFPPCQSRQRSSLRFKACLLEWDS